MKLIISIAGEIHSSKNSRQVVKTFDGKTKLIKSKQSKTDEESFAWQLNSQREAWDVMRRAVDPDAVLCVVFKFRRRTAGRFDYLNVAQGICDAMVRAG